MNKRLTSSTVDIHKSELSRRYCEVLEDDNAPEEKEEGRMFGEQRSQDQRHGVIRVQERPEVALTAHAQDDAVSIRGDAVEQIRGGCNAERTDIVKIQFVGVQLGKELARLHVR